MRRFPTTAVILTLAVVAAVGGWRIFAQSEADRYRAVEHVRASKSYVKLALHVEYPAGKIAREAYTLVDDDGRSSATYAVTDRKGTTATFDEQIKGYDVSFAFDKVVQDGIWELNTKGPRTLEDTKYTVSIEQTAQNQHGSRTFSFTEPKYWATAREFHIALDPNKPTPDKLELLKLQSTANAEPRYQKIVDDFESFGSARFRQTVAAARAKLLKS